MKFDSPIEQKLNDDLSLIVPAAWLNPKGLPIAEVQLFNGSLLHSDTICLSNHTARGKFIKATLKRATIEANKVEDALLLIGGNLSTTLNQELEDDADDSPKQTQAMTLINLTADAEFFHDANGDTYATIDVSGHKETWRIKLSGFRTWLLQRYYKETGGTASAQALQDALGVLDAKARYDGPEFKVFLRVGEADGKIYIDLCNDKWEAVEISETGWRVVADPPMKFRRSPGMHALPYPVAGGSIDELRPFINIGDDSHWILFCSWLVQALRPVGPYPVLVFHGEQGSAKSTAQAMGRSLVDPNSAPLRTEPRNEHDLIIAASNSWCVALDNLSNIPVWLSDALCRLATGGGFSTRQLYSDSDEVLFNAQRTVLINGIEELVTRGDLLDRALITYLLNIPENKRRPELQLWAEFNNAKPRILGALYDAVSCAMRNLPAIKLNRLPRLADFAMWATAAETGLGFEQGAFMDAYTNNRQSANDVVLESSAVASAVLAFAEKETVWLGQATELLTELNAAVADSTQRLKTWPKDGRALSNRLRRLAPNLRAAGVSVEFDLNEGKRKRLIRLEWVGNSASVASTASTDTESSNSANSMKTGDESAEADAKDAEYARKQADSDSIDLDFSYCPTCGYEGQRITDCPECGNEIR